MSFTDHTVSLFTLGDSEAAVASLTVEVGGEVFGAERSSRRARGDRYRRDVGQALATARVLRTVAGQIEAHAQRLMPFEAEVPPKPSTTFSMAAANDPVKNMAAAADYIRDQWAHRTLTVVDKTPVDPRTPEAKGEPWSQQLASSARLLAGLGWDETPSLAEEATPAPSLDWVRRSPGGAVYEYGYSDGSVYRGAPPTGAPHQFASGEAESTGGEQHGHS